ncbi:hypothetical protein P3S67_010648 [Capsicum chacoense]
MDDSPSFTLGLTQLEHTEITNSVVGFVLGVFDYEKPNFVENTSKNRNDTIKMKKINKVASSKSKKQIEESSKKSKKDDNGWPRLPKGVKYRIKNVLSHSLYFDSYCNPEFGSDIENYVGEGVHNLFHQIIFGSFLDMPQCNFQG